MPYVMDDLDELFIDRRVPAQSFPPGLEDRVDELRRSGCCDKLSWSNNGTIGYVADNGREVRVCSLRLKGKDGKWNLDFHDPPSLFSEHISKVFSGAQIAHISCNPHGFDWVIADVFGRLIVCAPYVLLEKLTTVKAYPGPQYETNRLIGIHWLQPKRPGNNRIALYEAAIKKEGKWVYEPSQMLPPAGPINMLGTAGFITITALGRISIYYSTPEWQSTTQDLFQIDDTDSLLTHATFCATRENELFVLVCSASKRTQITRIRFSWQQQPGQERPMPQFGFENLATISPASVVGDNPSIQASLEYVPSFFRLLYDRATTNDTPSLPMVLAVYHHIPKTEATFQSPLGPCTTIVQYQLHMEVPLLDSSFDTLSMKRSIRHPIKERIYVQQAATELLDGVVLDVREQHFGKELAFAYSDGKIEFRDRALKILPLDSAPDKVTGLSQIGFQLNSGESCLYNVLSPHSCMKATLGQGQKPKAAAIQVSVPLMEITDAEFIDKVCAVFALHNIAGTNGVDFNDILTSMTAFLQQLSLEQAAQAKARTLRYFAHGSQLSTQLHEPAEKLVTVYIVQRWLSFQEALGHGTTNEDRSAPSAVAWFMLNLRQLTSYILWALRQTQSQYVELQRPEVIEHMAHISRWTLVLMDWMVEQVLSTNRSIGFPRYLQKLGFPVDDIGSHISRNMAVVGTLLLSQLSRNMLKKVFLGVKVLLDYYRSNIVPQDMPPEWAAMQAAASEHAFPVPEFLNFLQSCDKICGTLSNMQDEEVRLDHELKLLTTAEFENPLTTIVAHMITAGSWDLRKSVDEAQLGFRDFSVLEMGQDERTRRWREEVLFDGIRKVELGRRAQVGKLPPLRVCTRCGIVMEDLPPPRSRDRDWLSMLVRQCLCGGQWVGQAKPESG